MNTKKSSVTWWAAGLLLLGMVGTLCWSLPSSVQAERGAPSALGDGAICEKLEHIPPIHQVFSAQESPASSGLASLSLDQVREAARALTPEAQSVLNSLDVQFHNLYPSMALNGATTEISVTINSDVCVQGMWAHISLPAQLTGGAKFAYATKSPSSVYDRLGDWIRFPFPALNGTASASVGLDGVAEGAYPFTWAIGYKDTVLLTQDGFLTVGACGSGAAHYSPIRQTLSAQGSPSPSGLASLSLDQMKEDAQALTPEAQSVLSSLDVQFHNLYPSMALNGATTEISVTINSDVCVRGMWAHISLPAQLTGGAKFAYATKSPSSVYDRLGDWIRFPFPALSGTAIAGVGLDGLAEGAYPFRWAIGYGDTVLLTQDGFLTVGACSGGAANLSTPSDLAGLSLDQMREAAQVLTPEAASVLNSLDIQFHDLYPSMALNGPTTEISVTITSDVCVRGMWAHISLPAQLTGGAKFAHATKSPSSVYDRLGDWIRFPFPALNGTSTVGVGLDGLAEGAYPFTWAIGYEDTLLLTQDGFLTVGACGSTLGPVADLMLSGVIPPVDIAAGDIVTVTVTAFNRGPGDALTVTVPVKVTGNAAITDVTACSKVAGTKETTVVCDVPKLRAGESITLAIKMEAFDDDPGLGLDSQPLAATLRAKILAGTHDPNPPNNVWIGTWGGSRVYLPLALRGYPRCICAFTCICQ